MTKKLDQKKGQKPTRNDEIRLRMVPPEIFKALAEIGQQYHQATIPKIIFRLIAEHKSTQDLLKQYQKRNDDLHQGIARYVNREAAMRNAIKDQIGNLGSAVRMSAAILKQFEAPKKRK